MFGFLKDKLKSAIGKLGKEVEKDAVIEKKEVLVEKKVDTDKKNSAIKVKEEIATILPEKKKGFFKKIFGRKEEEDIIEEKEELREIAENIDIPTIEEEIITKAPEKKHEKSIPIKKESEKITIKEDVKKEEVFIEPIIEPVDSIADSIPAKPITKSESKPESVIIKGITPDITPKKNKEVEIKRPEATVVKEKPRHQVLEEQREHKTIEHKEEQPKGFFTKITETFTKIQIDEERFEELFWELEVVLLENNVAVEVIEKIKRDLKKELMTGKVSRRGVDELITSTLRQSIIELFDIDNIDIISNIKAKKKTGRPYIVAIIGVNGSGKTTSIAKLAHKFQKEGLSVVLAASDTFRAAAIQQLEEHANNLNVKMIKHDYNSDPAAVAFDAIKYAEAKKVDVVIIDTAGRLHSNTNLMRELEKVIRVCKPDIRIFVGESITGNDCVEQAKEFDKAVGIDAIILAKADVDDKGGAAISVSYILQRPILYLGTGQTYDDLKEFDSSIIIESLGL